MKKYLLFSLCLSLSLNVFATTAATADDDGMAAAREALKSGGQTNNAAEDVPLRDTIITAKHMEYNRKENVAILTDDVVVDDARFHLVADRVYVFLENQGEPTATEGEAPAKDATMKVGDEDSKQTFSQIVCLGNVKVKSENRKAACDKAVYTRVDACLVLVGHASLTDVNEEGKLNTISGDKITIWTEEERIEVYPNPTLRLAPGSSKNVKDFM